MECNDFVQNSNFCFGAGHNVSGRPMVTNNSDSCLNSYFYDFFIFSGSKSKERLISPEKVKKKQIVI